MDLDHNNPIKISAYYLVAMWMWANHLSSLCLVHEMGITYHGLHVNIKWDKLYTVLSKVHGL